MLLRAPAFNQPLDHVPLGVVASCLQEPNMDDPLHKEAANVMRSNRSQFERVRVHFVVAAYFM